MLHARAHTRTHVRTPHTRSTCVHNVLSQHPKTHKHACIHARCLAAITSMGPAMPYCISPPNKNRFSTATQLSAGLPGAIGSDPISTRDLHRTVRGIHCPDVELGGRLYVPISICACLYVGKGLKNANSFSSTNAVASSEKMYSDRPIRSVNKYIIKKN